MHIPAEQTPLPLRASTLSQLAITATLAPESRGRNVDHEPGIWPEYFHRPGHRGSLFAGAGRFRGDLDLCLHVSDRCGNQLYIAYSWSPGSAVESAIR